jgi:hypothetical protein
LLLGLQHDNKFSYSIYMDNTPEIWPKYTKPNLPHSKKQSQIYLNCQTQIEDAVLQAFPEWIQTPSCDVAEPVNIEIHLEVVLTLVM